MMNIHHSCWLWFDLLHLPIRCSFFFYVFTLKRSKCLDESRRTLSQASRPQQLRWVLPYHNWNNGNKSDNYKPRAAINQHYPLIKQADCGCWCLMMLWLISRNVNDTHTGRSWAEDPPSDSSQTASQPQLDTKHREKHQTSWSVRSSINFQMEFPSNLLFWCSPCCCWAEVDLIPGITDLSHSFCLSVTVVWLQS